MERQIDSYHFGKITIDGTDYTEDVIITPKGVTAGWWRKKGHDISVFDLAEALAESPEILIIGTGAYGACTVLAEVEDTCRTQGIKLIVCPTPEAVVEYNTLEDKSRATAALHVTC